MADITNNPHRWLLPFWVDLHQQPFFGRLAPELKANALAAAVETDHPAKAQEIRYWIPTTRRAMLAVLALGLASGNTARETALWRLLKNNRELGCVAVHLPVGLDLRALENGEMRRTELFRDAAALRARAMQWRASSVSAGWREVE